jgi:hypothetical protein
VDPSTGIPLETRRYRMKTFYGCFTGNDIIQWLQVSILGISILPN